MIGQPVTGRMMGRRLLSVSIATQPNVRTGFGVEFLPAWELRKLGAVLLKSNDLKLESAPTHEDWMAARTPADLLDERVLQDLVVAQDSGMLCAIFDDGLELRALGAAPGEKAAWYVRHLESGWLLERTQGGLRLGPDA
jgi:hypothetical protein